jgi:MFS family permease
MNRMMSSKWQINLLFTSQLIIIAGLGMSDPYWPLIIHNSNHVLSPQQLQYWSAAIFIVPFFITVLTTPFWSHFGEKIGQKKMLLRACFALMVSQFLLCFVSQPIFVLVVRLLQGIFAGFSAAAQAWSITMSRPESHSYVIARLQSATAVGTIIGPIVGGCIANYFGYNAIFFVSALIFSLVIIVLMSQLPETPRKHSTPSGPMFKNPWHGLDKNLFFLLAMICFTQAARWMSSPFFALYVSQRLGGNNITVGILYSCIATMIFLSAPKWSIIIDKKTQQYDIVKWVFILTLFIAGLSQYLFAYMTNIYCMLFASLLWGICLSAISLIPSTLLIRYTEEQHRGKVIGLGSSATKLGNLIGVALGAFVQAETNFTCSFVVIGLLYFALSGILLMLHLHPTPMEQSPC